MFLRPVRLTSLFASTLGVAGIFSPWWELRWTWPGGLFERLIFLYGNAVQGDLSGLGVPAQIGVNVPAYEFASFALTLVILASVAGVYGGLGDAARNLSLRAVSSVLFLSAALVFVLGLSSVLADEGRSMFSSVVLASSDSYITTGLTLGFYFVVVAAFLVGLSYLTQRGSLSKSVPRKPTRSRTTT